MIGPYLWSKWHWERDEPVEAAPYIDELAGGRPDAHALWLPREVLERRSHMTFENALASLLATDDHLIAPFRPVAESLWRAFPGQVVLHVLEQRAEAGQPDTQLLHQMASDGVLSLEASDRDRIARVVLDADAAPTLVAHADMEELQREIDGAVRRLPAEQLAELLLDAAFHRTPVAYPEVAIDSLTRMARDEPQAVDLAAAELGAREGDAADTIVRVGMRLENGSRECLASLVAGLRSRSFESFADDCLLD